MSVSAEEIRQTPFSEFPVSEGGQSQDSVPALLLQRFPLGWSHYVTLLSVTDPDARRFYEIEAPGSDGSPRQAAQSIRQETARIVFGLLKLNTAFIPSPGGHSPDDSC